MKNLNHETARFFINEAEKYLAAHKKTTDPEEKLNIIKKLINLKNRISYEIELIEKIIRDEENA